MIFDFVVRRLHWMSRVPLASQLFDAGLLIGTALFRRQTLRAMEEFEERVLRIRGVELCVHRFGGVGFRFGEKEIAHVHSNGLLDVRLRRGEAEELVKRGQALRHHVLGTSRWVSFWIRTERDVEGALRLMETVTKTGGA